MAYGMAKVAGFLCMALLVAHVAHVESARLLKQVNGDPTVVGETFPTDQSGELKFADTQDFGQQVFQAEETSEDGPVLTAEDPEKPYNYNDNSDEIPRTQDISDSNPSDTTDDAPGFLVPPTTDTDSTNQFSQSNLLQEDESTDTGFDQPKQPAYEYNAEIQGQEDGEPVYPAYPKDSVTQQFSTEFSFDEEQKPAQVADADGSDNFEWADTDSSP